MNDARASDHQLKQLAGRMKSGSTLALFLLIVLLAIDVPVTVLGWVVAIVLGASMMILVLSARMLLRLIDDHHRES
jgi:hypothetical protein